MNKCYICKKKVKDAVEYFSKFYCKKCFTTKIGI